MSSRAQRWTGLSDREVFAERARGLPWSSSRWAPPWTAFAPKLVVALAASVLCLLSLFQAGKDSGFFFAFLAYGAIAALLFWFVLRPASYARLEARQAAGNYAFFAAQGRMVRQVDMLLPCDLTGRWRVALLGKPGEDRQSLLARSRAVAQHASWEDGPWWGLARLLREYGSTMGQPAPVLTDAAGNQFSVLCPGEFVTLLSDGWVLGFAEQSQEAPQCTGYQVSVPDAGLGSFVVRKGALLWWWWILVGLVVFAVWGLLFGASVMGFHDAPLMASLVCAVLAGGLYFCGRYLRFHLGTTNVDEEGVHFRPLFGRTRHLAWLDVRRLRTKTTKHHNDHYGSRSVSLFLVLDRRGREIPLPGYCGAGQRVNGRQFLSDLQREFYLRWLAAVGERMEATEADEGACRVLPPRRGVRRRDDVVVSRDGGRDGRGEVRARSPSRRTAYLFE